MLGFWYIINFADNNKYLHLLRLLIIARKQQRHSLAIFMFDIFHETKAHVLNFPKNRGKSPTQRKNKQYNILVKTTLLCYFRWPYFLLSLAVFPQRRFQRTALLAGQDRYNVRRLVCTVLKFILLCNDNHDYSWLRRPCCNEQFWEVFKHSDNDDIVRCLRVFSE